MAYATVKNDSLSAEPQQFTSQNLDRAAPLFSRRRDFTVPFSKRGEIASVRYADCRALASADDSLLRDIRFSVYASLCFHFACAGVTRKVKLRLAVLRSLYDFLFALLAIAGGIAALILFKRDYFGAIDDQGRVAVTFIGGAAVVFFLYSLYLTVRWGRTVRYGRVLSHLNQGFSYVHMATRTARPTSREILEACKKLCDTMAMAFSVLTTSPCSVTIKILARLPGGEPDVRIRVLTMCRDSQSAGMRDYPSETVHWLDENTDFDSIVRNISTPRGRFFFSNRLPFYYGYRNTSFEICGGEPKTTDIPGLREFLRYWRWPLPYKSTIVSPISPGISSQRVPNNLIGFLCVDSAQLGAFRERFDTDILVGVADGVFAAVAKYIDLVEGEVQ